MDMQKYKKQLNIIENNLSVCLFKASSQTFSMLNHIPDELRLTYSNLNRECFFPTTDGIVSQIENRRNSLRLNNDVDFINFARDQLSLKLFESIHNFYALTSVGNEVNATLLSDEYKASYSNFKGIFETALVAMSASFSEIDRNNRLYEGVMNSTKKHDDFITQTHVTLKELGTASLLLAKNQENFLYSNILNSIADGTISMAKKIEVLQEAHTEKADELEDKGYFAKIKLHINFPGLAIRALGSSLEGLNKGAPSKDVKTLSTHLTSLRENLLNHVDEIAPSLNFGRDAKAGRG